MLKYRFRGFDYSALDVACKLRNDIDCVFHADIEQVGQNRVNIVVAAYPAVFVLSEGCEILNDIARFDFAEFAVSDRFEDIFRRNKFADKRGYADIADFLNKIFIVGNEIVRERKRIFNGDIVYQAVEIILFFFIGVRSRYIEDMIENIENVCGNKFSERRVNLFAFGVLPFSRSRVVIEVKECINIIPDHMIDVYRRVVSRSEEVISKALSFVL